MTNQQIIFNKQLELLKNGVIKTTGRVYKDNGGNSQPEPEPIHTYKAWQEIGRQVKKGEKNKAAFSIWKHITRKDKKTGEKTEKMVMVRAYFFTFEQTEPIQAK